MGQVVAFVSGKGGTGKTSLTALVGAALARLGKRVLLLDCDIGLRNLDLVLGMSDRVLMDFFDVAAQRTTLDEAAPPHPHLPNLFLLTAPATTATIPAPDALRSFFAAVREHYDFCLTDGGAGLGEAFRLATQNADRALVITTPEPVCLRDAQRTVTELLWGFPDGSLHLVVNRLRRSLLRSLHANVDDVMDAAGLPLLGIVPEDEDLPTLLAKGCADEFDYYSPACRAAKNIARRLCGERVPLMRL